MQLLVVESQQVGFGFFDLVKHFLSKSLGGCDLFSFSLVDFSIPVSALLLQLLFELIEFCFQLVLLFVELVGLIDGVFGGGYFSF